MKYLTLHRICKEEASRLSQCFSKNKTRNNSSCVFYDRFSDEEILYQEFFKLGRETFKWRGLGNKVERIELGYLKNNGKKIYAYFKILGTYTYMVSECLLNPSTFNYSLVDSVYISLTTEDEDEI